MKNRRTRICLFALLALTLLSTACTSTRSENGVQIQQKRSLNPLDYIPYL